ncbi:MAG: DUF4325 domain-containing protein [Proteobacteria bacterium]|nr:DUF4325 domain-containing protein [Pseudomonadota bacterium]
MSTKEISVAEDFSRYPIGRTREESAYCGDVFRERHLVPAFKNAQTVHVNLDGTAGYGSSFLDQAFGGLVRYEGYTADELHQRLKLTSNDDESLIAETWGYINDA